MTTKQLESKIEAIEKKIDIWVTNNNNMDSIARAQVYATQLQAYAIMLASIKDN